MAMLRDPGAVLQLTGIPLRHMDAFQRVANAKNCVIMSRAVGTSCTQLIEESYSSKGFHVKAKSCDWGPMAGFVLADPNLTKRAPVEVDKQKSDLEHAFKDWGAGSTPLYISTNRRDLLMKEGKITRRGGDDASMIVSAKQTSDGGPYDKVLRKYFFRLERVDASRLQNAPADVMYAVKYVSPDKAFHVGGGEGDHVHAMVNPHGLGGRVPGVRAALTGDYDLFSVAASRARYAPGTGVDGKGEFNRGYDARMISVPGLEKNIKAGLKDVGEDVHMGNLTGRLRELKDALNRSRGIWAATWCTIRTRRVAPSSTTWISRCSRWCPRRPGPTG